VDYHSRTAVGNTSSARLPDQAVARLAAVAPKRSTTGSGSSTASLQTSTNIPGFAADGGPSTCTFSGGISARLTALPDARYSTTPPVRDPVTVASGSDATVRTFVDPSSQLTLLEVLDQSRPGKVELICRYPLLFVTSISHANTKRGIAVEIREGRAAGGLGDSLTARRRGAPNVLLQLSFLEPAARERVITALQRAWQIEKQRHEPPMVSHREEYPNDIGGGGGRSGSPTPQGPSGASGSSAFSSLLSNVRMLQEKTRSVLTELRGEDRTLFGEQGEFNFGQESPWRKGSDDELKAWAYYQLQRRTELMDAERELRQIQQKRKLRRAVFDEMSPRLGLEVSVPRSVSPTNTVTSTGGPMFRSQGAADGPGGMTCPHCKRLVGNADHIPRCAERKVRCKSCGMIMRARDKDTHKSSGACDGAYSDASSVRDRPSASRPSTAGTASIRPATRAPSSESDSSWKSTTPPGSPRTPSGPRRISFQEPSRGQVESASAAARVRSPTSTSGRARSGTAEGASSGTTADGEAIVTCPHCYRPAPAKHVPRCGYRLMRCRRCGEELTARDKVRHDETCQKNRTGPRVPPDPSTVTTPPVAGKSRFEGRQGN
jgi:hypothetical protein